MLDRVVADVWEKDVWEFQAKSGKCAEHLSGRTPLDDTEYS